MKHSQYLEKSLTTLGALNRDELLIVQRAIEHLLIIVESIEENESDEPDEPVERQRRAVGYIEEKLIRGFGPYLYLRRWEGKKLTSTYIGKARS
jgi:hypothetical protein